MKYLIGFIGGVLLSIGLVANAGFFGSAVGGAVGGAIGTSGVESKIDTINARIEALTRALDSVKVCK
jgi:hypothetical protein